VPPTMEESTLRCPHCGSVGRHTPNLVDWRPGAQSHSRSRQRRPLWQKALGPADNVRRLGRALRYFFNPVTSPLSPLAWLGRARLRRFYERTRSDPETAWRWAEHYLAGLPADRRLTVLDHGTGKGRHIGILSQLGFEVSAQDVESDPWWQNFPGCRLQIVPDQCDHLPWKSGTFDLVLDWMVIEHFDAERLARLVAEISRVLKSGGHWLVLTANADGLGANVVRRYAGRLHPFESVARMAGANGMAIARHAYEGFYAPVFPILTNALRKTLAPRAFDLADHDSTLARLIPAHRRALWLAAFRKV
jgi:SAM-dependent methyltransferase